MKISLESEAWGEILQHSPVIICTIDRNGCYKFINDACKVSLGYEPEELIGTHTLSFIHPDDLQLVKDSISKLLISETHVKISAFRFKNAKGEWRWLQTSISNQLNNPAINALISNSIDITETVNNKLKLQEREKNFKSFFEYHPDITLLHSKEGIIVDLNAAALSFFALPKQDLMNRPFTDFLSPETVPFYEKSLQKARKGESLKLNLEISSEGQANFAFAAALIPVMVKGETVGVYTILKDTNVANRSHHIIKQQAEKLNTIMESLTEAFFTMDKDWNFTYVNPELERLFGTEREELLGKNFFALVDEKIKKEFFRNYNDALERGKTANYETYLEKFNIWLQVKAFPSEEGLSVFLSDITEKVKSRQDLEKLSLVASKTTNGVVITNSNILVEWVNEGFTKLTGYTLSEVKGKIPGSVLMGEETDSKTYDRLIKNLKQGKPFHDEILLYKKSGDKLWILLDISPVIDEAGEVIRNVSIMTDVTFRKEVEESQLQLTKDLFRQNRDLQEFTYIVSHNLRSPVANAMGLIDLLSSSDKNSESFDIPLTYLKTSVQQLDAVLRDLNTILTIRERKDTVNSERIQLNQICNQVLKEFKETLAVFGGVVNIDIEENIFVRGNKAYLYSIFYNLLSNAIKYRSTRRALKVNIKCFCRTDRGIILSFSDNGVGFDIGLAGDKIFKLYKRFHNNSNGRGKGLFLIKTYLEAMGGHIEVNSLVNSGTRFLIYLQ